MESTPTTRPGALIWSAAALVLAAAPAHPEASFFSDYEAVSRMTEAVNAHRNVTFDLVFLLSGDGEDAVRDQYPGYDADDVGGGASILPTVHVSQVGAFMSDDDDFLAWDDRVRTLRTLTIWPYTGPSTMVNFSSRIRALPKRHPTQELWILDDSPPESPSSARSALETNADSVTVSSQVYLFEPTMNGTAVSVSEVYSFFTLPSIPSPELVVERLAEYVPADGSVWPALGDAAAADEEELRLWREDDDYFYGRRSDLRGRRLTFLVETSLPHCGIDADAEPGQPTTAVYGSFVDVVLALASELNFTAEFVRSPSPLWTDLVAYMEEGLYDASATSYSLTEDRMRKVPFSVPMDTSAFVMAIKKPQRSLSWTTYVTPFSVGFWICAAVNVLVCSVALYFATNTESSGGASLNLSLPECVSMNLLAMVNIGASVVPTRPSSRILFFGILVCGTVFWASYQASLTSTLTVILTHLPVADLKEALDGGFRIAVWKGTAIEDIMAGSPSGSVARNVWAGAEKDDTLRKINSDGLEFVASNEDAIFITGDVEVIFSPEFYPCRVTYIKSFTVADLNIALAYGRGFKLKPLFDYFINKILQSGQYRRFVNEYTPVEKDCAAAEVSMGFENIVSAFVALAVGTAVACVVAVAECLRRRRRRND